MPAQPAMQTSAGWGAGVGGAPPTPPAPPRDATGLPGPRAHTARDLVILAAVVVVLALLLWVRSGAEYDIPVALGNGTITNPEEIIADTVEGFDELVQSQGGRVAEDASCYFYRPLGPTQGAFPTGAIPTELLVGGLEDATSTDLLLCGPVELSGGLSGSVPGMEAPPFVVAVVAYSPVSPDNVWDYRGEFVRILPMALNIIAATGGVDAEHLLDADGRSPDQGDIDEPTWREVSPSGEPPPDGGLGGDGTSPSVTLPPDMTVPSLPADISVPTLPSDMTIPSIPGG